MQSAGRNKSNTGWTIQRRTTEQLLLDGLAISYQRRYLSDKRNKDAVFLLPASRDAAAIMRHDRIFLLTFQNALIFSSTSLRDCGTLSQQAPLLLIPPAPLSQVLEYEGQNTPRQIGTSAICTCKYYLHGNSGYHSILRHP